MGRCELRAEMPQRVFDSRFGAPPPESEHYVENALNFEMGFKNG